jgi:hypothetical protein
VLVLERLSDSLGEIAHRKGFHNEILDPHSLCLFLADTFTKSGAQHNRDIGANLHEFLGQLISCHIRHGHVGNNQIKPLWIYAEQLQGLVAAHSRCDLITEMR